MWRITVGAVLSVPVAEKSLGPPKSALESNPLPGGSGRGASFRRAGLGDAVEDDWPVLAPAVIFFAAAFKGKHSPSASSCMAPSGRFRGGDSSITVGPSCAACTLLGDMETFGGDGGAGVGVATLEDNCRVSWEKGIGGVDLVIMGGSIKLAIDGDALARLAVLGGVGDTGGALNGL